MPPPHLVSVTKPQSASSSSHLEGQPEAVSASPPSANVAPTAAVAPVPLAPLPPEPFKPPLLMSSGLPQPDPKANATADSAQNKRPKLFMQSPFATPAPRKPS